MKHKGLILTTIFLGIVGLGFALYAFIKREMLLAMSFCYKFSNVKLINTSKNNFIIDLTIKIRNQSDLRVNLTSYSFQVFINDKFVTTLSNETNTDVLANAVSELTIRIDFDPSKMFSLVDALQLAVIALTDQSKFFITINGSVSAKINFISIKNLPINMKMSLADIMKPEDPNAPAKFDCKIV